MSKPSKKSVLLDLSHEASTESRPTNRLPLYLIAIVGIIALAFVTYRLLPKKDSIEIDPTPSSEITASATAASRPIESEQSRPIESEQITNELPENLTPKTTPTEDSIEFGQQNTKTEFHMGDHLQAILQISKKHDSLPIPAAQLIQSEALAFQLKNTQRETDESSYLALQDAYALSISESISDAIVHTIQVKQDLYRNQLLTSYGALEWQRLQSLIEQRDQAENAFAALQASDRAMQSMQAFEESAEQTLAALAQRHATNGDLQTAASTYYKLLTLSPADPTAIKFLHHHADTAGSAKTFAATGIKMRFIPAGEFIMGTNTIEFQRDADETQHQVILSESFYLSETEVTQAQWMQVMGSLPEQFPAPYNAANAQLPIHSVAWKEALAYCHQLSELDPEGSYRLPTEAEWEYACRAGSATPYNTQSDRLTSNDANIFDPAASDNNDSAIAVASYAPNAWGLYDMHGNVWEWTNDWKLEYKALSSVDPAAPHLPTGTDETLSTKVLRGGSYYDEAGFARSGNRWNYAPSIATEYIGFRVVRDVQF